MERVNYECHERVKTWVFSRIFKSETDAHTAERKSRYGLENYKLMIYFVCNSKRQLKILYTINPIGMSSVLCN